MRLLHTSEVIEIDLYLVISFFNFFFFLIQSDIFILVQKIHVRTVPVCFSCTTGIYSLTSNFKKQTNKKWDKQKTTAVPHHEKYFD